MFSFGGWNSIGPAITYEQSCASEDGCTDDTNNDEAIGQISAYVGGLENDTGVDHNIYHTPVLIKIKLNKLLLWSAVK